MESLEDSRLEAERILRDAGWKPVPLVVGAGGENFLNTEGRFVFGSLICGLTPYARVPYASKELSKIPQARAAELGLDPADYPDEPHEGAAWLVAHVKGLAGEGEPEESAAHEAHGETGVPLEAEARTAVGQGVPSEAPEQLLRTGIDGDDFSGGSGETLADSGVIGRSAGGRSEDASEVHDADFTEVDFAALDEAQADPRLLTEDIKDFAPDEIVEQDHGPGAFIFGDNLEQKRTAAIGVVVQMALERLPAGVDYAALSELRNFAMGVTEGRWPDDPAKRDELDAMEALERRRRMVEAVRDEKVGFLVNANREQIEGFDPNEGWP